MAWQSGTVGFRETTREGNEMARTATGNKKGLEAFNVLKLWRAEGVPEYVTEYEAWYLTGGIVGNSLSAKGIRLIEVAVKYTIRGGSVKDYLAIKEGE